MDGCGLGKVWLSSVFFEELFFFDERCDFETMLSSKPPTADIIYFIRVSQDC